MCFLNSLEKNVLIAFVYSLKTCISESLNESFNISQLVVSKRAEQLGHVPDDPHPIPETYMVEGENINPQGGL